MARMCNEEIIYRESCQLALDGVLKIDEGGIEPIHTYAEWQIGRAHV